MEQSPGIRQIHTKDGFRVAVSREGLPPFLIKAKEAIDLGNITEANRLLDDQAVGNVGEMLKKDPTRTDAMFMLGRMLFELKQGQRAEECYKMIVNIEPNALVYHELGRICWLMQRPTEATQYQRKAVEAEPDNTVFQLSLALDLTRQGQIEDGVRLLREIVEKRPDNVNVHSKLLFQMHYLPDLDRQMLFDEHKRWGQTHAPTTMAKKSHDNDPDPDRRLRIGYISPDFRKNSAAYNFKAFLDGRNHGVVEVYGYGSVAEPDGFTKCLMTEFDRYRDVYALDDEAVAHLIEQDKIDILVEIGGHVGGNRLLILAYKPAPIQVDCGGFNTSGMQQIDYRLTDSLLDPGELQKYYVEESVYLPQGLFCYTAPDFTPAVVPLPALENGYVTFGSFNNNTKVSSYIISLWSEILRANDNSRLIMKFKGGGDQGLKDFYWQQFERLGIVRDRVEIHGWIASRDHLNLYGQVDIALDTYPYNGCVTTLEGFWMGVPIVSLVGKNNFLSRVGLSLLSRAGLEFFAASTPKEYVAKATALAKNLDALAKIRDSLRQRMAVSTLCDAKGYAKSAEAAYRKMWHRWCQSQGVDVPNVDLASSNEYCGVVFSSELTESFANIGEGH